MTELPYPGPPKPPPKESGLWERWWPRILAVVQAGIGTYMVLHETNSESADPTVLGFGVFLLGAIPATVFAARILGGK